MYTQKDVNKMKRSKDGYIYFKERTRFENSIVFPKKCKFGCWCAFEYDCVFGSGCIFGSNCMFGFGCIFESSCVFGSGCVFGFGCSFRNCCRFDSHCLFGHDCEFGYECKFEYNCAFGNTCKFESGCSFRKYEKDVLFKSRLGELSDELTLELMRWDAFSHPNPELFNKWAKGGSCPYNWVIVDRVFNFNESERLWKPGKPQMTLFEVFAKIFEEKGWTINE